MVVCELFQYVGRENGYFGVLKKQVIVWMLEIGVDFDL